MIKESGPGHMWCCVIIILHCVLYLLALLSSMIQYSTCSRIDCFVPKSDMVQ